MNWIHLALAGLAVLLTAGVFWKLYLRRRLDDIDGCGCIQKRGSENENVIACFGDDEDPEKGAPDRL